MLDANSKSARTIATAAVLGAAIVHSCFNAAFGWSMGSTTFEKYLFAGFGVCTDICKVFALAFAAYAFERRRWAKGLGCLIVWGTTIAYSGVAATGFAALVRDTVVASRTEDVNDYKHNVAERRRYLADMEAARISPLFAETFGCTQDLVAKDVGRDKAAKAKQFCHLYWRASSKYEEIRPLVRNASLTQSDPQTAIVATMLAISRDKAAIGLAIFLAVVAEIVSALGTWTFSRSITKPTRAERQQRAERRQQGRNGLRLAVNNK